MYTLYLFPIPKIEWERETISEQYNDEWIFPCIGAMDGKNILIKHHPAMVPSSFSIMLLAVVDANYKFLYVDIGCNG